MKTSIRRELLPFLSALIFLSGASCVALDRSRYGDCCVRSQYKVKR